MNSTCAIIFAHEREHYSSIFFSAFQMHFHPFKASNINYVFSSFLCQFIYFIERNKCVHVWETEMVVWCCRRDWWRRCIYHQHNKRRCIECRHSQSSSMATRWRRSSLVFVCQFKNILTLVSSALMNPRSRFSENYFVASRDANSDKRQNSINFKR